MMVILIIGLVVVIGLVVAVVVGRVGSDTMSDPSRTSSFELPEGPLGSHGIESLRLDQSLRGYNMAQVDAVLDKLSGEIAELEAQRDGRGTGATPLDAEHADPARHPGSVVPFRSGVRHTEEQPDADRR